MKYFVPLEKHNPLGTETWSPWSWLLTAGSRQERENGEAFCSAKTKNWTVAPLPALLNLASEDGFQLLIYIQLWLQEGTCPLRQRNNVTIFSACQEMWFKVPGDSWTVVLYSFSILIILLTSSLTTTWSILNILLTLKEKSVYVHCEVVACQDVSQHLYKFPTDCYTNAQSESVAQRLRDEC